MIPSLSLSPSPDYKPLEVGDRLLLILYLPEGEAQCLELVDSSSLMRKGIQFESWSFSVQAYLEQVLPYN